MNNVYPFCNVFHKTSQLEPSKKEKQNKKNFQNIGFAATRLQPLMNKEKNITGKIYITLGTRGLFLELKPETAQEKPLAPKVDIYTSRV